MIKIELKDGAIIEVEKGSSIIDVAKKISEGLARVTLAGLVNGEVQDLRHKLTEDCKLEILTFDSLEGKKAYWHTTSHIMAQAIKRLYPEIKLAIGPSIDNGFYYDFDTEKPFSEEDLIKIEDEMKKIYATGRGSVKLRSKYNYDKSANCIEITQIPYSTTIEAIIEKIIELIKAGKIREISYIRDETDLSGLKIAIDLKRGTDPEKLMNKLFKLTPLQDNFACNFNILIGGTPKVMGVREILEEWIAFREECVKRRVYFDLNKKKDKLHLLKGLGKILLDIDKAIKIVRETEEENEVVSNLMVGFGIDEIQAEYVAEIKLRHLNREYILNRLNEIESLEKEISEMEDILSSKNKIRSIIISELKEVIKKYSKPRNTMFFYKNDIEDVDIVEEIPDYPVNLFLSGSGYFKKITPQSLRMSSEQKLKEGDSIIIHKEATNLTELLFFTDKCQVYKSRASAFDDTKASVLGDYVPAKLGFDEGEELLYMADTIDYEGYMLFFFENGKAAKVPLKAYETKTNRKKLANAYSGKSKLCGMLYISEDIDIIAPSCGLAPKTPLANVKALVEARNEYFNI